MDVTTVEGIERTCRERLKGQPDNYEARLALAWCLFLRAVHEAGRESVCGESKADGGWPTTIPSDSAPPTIRQSSSKLLRECLSQAATVRQLSPRESDRAGVRQIGLLVRMAGDEQVLRDVDREAEAVLRALTRAIWLAR